MRGHAVAFAMDDFVNQLEHVHYEIFDGKGSETIGATSPPPLSAASGR